LLQYATLSQLIDISAKPVLISKLLFGKYSGRYIEEIVNTDIAYLHWLLALDDIDEDLAYSIRYYL
jgi:exodeoxyribonuclease X